MLWEIRGTRGGKAIRAKVAASSEESARRKAVANGVAVTSVTLLEDPSAPTQAVATPSPEAVEVNPQAPPYAGEPAPEPSDYPPAAYAPADPAPAFSPQFSEPAQYGAPPVYAATVPSADKFGGMAIASLCCSCGALPFMLLGFFCCPTAVVGVLASLTGIVLGIIAWLSANKVNNKKARAMAMAGTFTGAGALVLLVILLVVSVVWYGVMVSRIGNFPH